VQEEGMGVEEEFVHFDSYPKERIEGWQ